MAKPRKDVTFLASAVALNAATDGSPPARITVIPAPDGGRVRGIDGREWSLSDPAALATALNAHTVDLPLDENHSTELLAPKGLPSPARGWMKAGTFLALNGALTVEVEWTDEGSDLLARRAYRYLSPALRYRKSDRAISGIYSAGLVPKPNLTQLPGLNALGAVDDDSTSDEPPMNEEQVKALCAAMGIAATTDANTITAAAKALKTARDTALNSAAKPGEGVDLNSFVPRADYDVALNRANTAETKLAEQTKADLQAKAAALVDGAVKAGKVAPASKDFYLGLCSSNQGYEQVRTHLEKAPAIIPEGERVSGGPPPADADTALNARDPLLAEAFGNSVEDLKKYGA